MRSLLNSLLNMKSNSRLKLSIGGSAIHVPLTVLVAALGMLSGTAIQAADSVEISNIWARESPPTVTNAAVYMTIRDLGANGDRLLGVSTDIAQKAELHIHEKVEATNDHTSAPDSKDMKHGDMKHGEMKHGEMKHDMSRPTMMKMRKVESIEIPADGLASLEPGGLHVMLFDIDAPLKDQQSFEMILEFEKAGNLPVTVKVKKPQ